MLTATDLLSTALQELTVALEAPDRPITSIEDQVTLNNNIRHIQSLLNVPRLTPEDETKPGGRRPRVVPLKKHLRKIPSRFSIRLREKQDAKDDADEHTRVHGGDEPTTNIRP